MEDRHVDEETIFASHEMPSFRAGVSKDVEVRRQYTLGRPRCPGRKDDRLRIPGLNGLE